MKDITRRDFLAGTAAVGVGALIQLAGPLTVSLTAAASMARRPLGRTGLEVSLVGFGGGSRFFEPIKDDEAGAELVRRAIDGGMTLLETASDYGDNGESERRIGLGMKGRRNRVVVETKVNARDYDGAMREMERSLKYLQTDHVDLMLHHNIGSLEELESVAAADGAERAFQKMMDQKAVRFRGFSCHLPAVTAAGIRRLKPDVVQCPINATRVPDFEAEVLAAAKGAGVGVIAMKTCGHGYFQRDNATKPDRIDQFGPPPGVFERKGLPGPQDFLCYALSLPLSTAVVGIDSPDTLAKVLAVAAGFTPMAAAEMAPISRRAQAFATTGYWIPRRT